METYVTNSGEPDQTPHFAASDLVLHCLPMSHKMDVRLIRVTSLRLNGATVKSTCL